MTQNIEFHSGVRLAHAYPEAELCPTSFARESLVAGCCGAVVFREEEATAGGANSITKIKPFGPLLHYGTARAGKAQTTLR